MKRIRFSIKITNTTALSILMTFSSFFQGAHIWPGLPGATPAQTPSRPLEKQDLVVAQFGDQKPRRAGDPGFVDIPGGLKKTDNRNECWFQMVFQAMYARAVFEGNGPMQELLAKCQTDSSSKTQIDIMQTITSEAFIDALPDFIHRTQTSLRYLDKAGLKGKLPSIQTALSNYQTQGDDFLVHLDSLVALARSCGQNGTDLEIEASLQKKLVNVSDDNLKIISYLLRTYQFKALALDKTRPSLIKEGNVLNETFKTDLLDLANKKRNYATFNVLLPGHWCTLVLWEESGQMRHLWLDSLYSWAGQNFQDKGAEPERKLAITNALKEEFDKIKAPIQPIGDSINLEQKLLLDLLILKTEKIGRAISGANLRQDFHLKRVCSSPAELLQGEEAFKREEVIIEEASERAVLLNRHAKALEQQVATHARQSSRRIGVLPQKPSSVPFELPTPVEPLQENPLALEARVYSALGTRIRVAKEKIEKNDDLRVAPVADRPPAVSPEKTSTNRKMLSFAVLATCIFVLVGGMVKFRKQSWSTIKAIGAFVQNQWSNLGAKKSRKVKKPYQKALTSKPSQI